MSCTGALLSRATSRNTTACTATNPACRWYAARQLPSASISAAPVLTAIASRTLCCDNPTALMSAYCRLAAHW